MTSEKKVFVLALAAMFVASAVFAVEVTAEQAQTAARNWITRSSRRMEVAFRSAKPEAVETVKSESGQTIYHAMNLDGGGFVVTAGDTRQTPIVAFSASGRYVENESNPLSAILRKEQSNVIAVFKRQEKKDAAAVGALRGGNAVSVAELEWADLLSDGRQNRGRLDAASRNSVSDVRVHPLVITKWGQSNWGDSFDQPEAFNYYTPNNYLCGCVATAGAQIMKFWEMPRNSIDSFSNMCQLNDAFKQYSSIPGTFDWNNMPLSYDLTSSITPAQCQAVGKLTYNIGVAVAMNWTGFDRGSGAYTGDLIDALKSRFGYASGTYVTYDIGAGETTGLSSFRNALYASLDAGMPVSMSIGGGADGGHSVVADGYGYSSGTLYTHINMGWSGFDDVWYNLVDEVIYCTDQGYTFPCVTAIGFNIHPTASGDVISGRVANSSGIAVSGATVSLLSSSKSQIAFTTSNAKGIYSFRVMSPGQYYVRATDGGATSSDIAVSISAMSAGGDYWNGGDTGNRWGINPTLGVAAGGDAYDPADDTAAGGTWLTPTKTEQTHGPHTLSPTDPYDCFRISMTAGSTYVFESTGSFDMYGELFDSDDESNRVAYDDDNGEGNNFKIEYTPKVSKTHYLKVRRYAVGDEGAYTLKYSYSGGAQAGTYVRVEGYSNVNCTLGSEAVRFMSKVDCDGAWSVSVDDTSWGLVLETSGGIGNGYFYFTVPQNTGYNRRCTFTVTSGSLSAYKNLTQFGPLGEKPVLDAWDPGDDTAPGGTLITPDTTVRSHGLHTLSSTDEYDFFRIPMLAGRTYVFESTGSSDTYGELYDAPDNFSGSVAFNDDSDNRNFKVAFTPTSSKVYYLCVRLYSVGDLGSYGLNYYYIPEASDYYTVRFNKNDGSGATADQSFKVGETKSLLWKDSELKWTRDGYTFKGWAESASGAVKYANGEKVKDIAAAGATKNLYAIWQANQTTYTVRFNKNDGSGATANQTFKVGETKNLLWKDSELGWSRSGYTFKGWAESVSGAVKYANGEKVKDIASAGATKNLYAVWAADQSTYTVRFNKNDGTGATKDQSFKVGETKSLLWKDSELKWTRAGYTFKGWAESASGSVKYANGAKVKDIASAGATKNLYAIWQSNQATYTVRFHKYDGTGATADQVFKVGETKNLLWKDSQLKWSRDGYTFVGWVPWDPDGKNCILCKYVNGEKVKDLGKAGEVVHLYAGWRSSYRYQVCFNKNDGTGATMIQVMLRDKDVGLAWKDSQIGWTRAGYTFKGWAESASGSVKYANGAKVKNLVAAGSTKQLYAVWTKADSVSAAPRIRAAAVAAPKAVVPEWAVGTFYGWDEDSFATVTVSAGGEVSGMVLFENDTWTIEGTASGLCIDAEVVDGAGNAKQMVLWLSLDDDGHVVIKSEGDLICVMN